MFRLRLLGGFTLDGPSGATPPPLAIRKAEAVLAMLAVYGELGCTRARLIGLLWPDSDETHARHNLRDTLRSIRRTIGREAVPGRGEALRLVPAHVTSDVQEFKEALGAGRLAEVVATYRGPLLEGFHLDGAGGFERWLEDERARFARDCQDAVKGLARKAELDDRWDEAADWWGRAVLLDRFNSRYIVRRMVALARVGDRANALLEGEAHCALLRSELELDPDASFLEALDRIRAVCCHPPPASRPNR